MANVFLMLVALVLLIAGVEYSFLTNNHLHSNNTTVAKAATPTPTELPPTVTPAITSPLSIVTMRQNSYPGSALTVVQTLPQGTNYNRYVVSYQSDGLKLYGLLTVPTSTKPSGGYPVIIFNHGYIAPASYSTTTSYAVMVDPLAAAGYIVFMPDYRGYGNSAGTPAQPYVSSVYVTDSMNALSSIKKYKDANPQKIGVFGHSMGGNIALHELVMTHDIKAAELMAGVVGDETGLAQWWSQRFTAHSIVGNDLDTYYAFEQMIKDHGTPEKDPTYWNAIDPTKFLDFISVPVEIQVGSADEVVPTNFSTALHESLQQAGKNVTFKEYTGADHNLAPDTSAAMTETVAFFNKYLK
jgi:dipeptidyl aminopeptidase/acylaminoacyl peptidase